jgi:DNA (cytosine-5)-methyltransferase 1
LSVTTLVPRRRAASFFTGIGGFDIGFEEAGWTIASQVEINKHARMVLEHRWPDVPLLGDITEVKAHEIGNVDTFLGGFPCQDVSIGAPHRLGLAGARSHLFFEFTRLVEAYANLIDASNPEWVVLENVPGLLVSNGGADMGSLAQTLADLGYVGAWRVVDAAGLGVPHRRRRLIVVGHRGEAAGVREVLLDPEGGRTDPRLVDPCPDGGKPGRPPAGTSAEDHLSRLMFRKSRRPRSKLDYATWPESDISNTLNGFDAGVARTTNLIVEGDRARILTPLEWERLQGFPDEHTDVGLSDNQRFNALGNAIAVPMAHWVARRIAAVAA